MGIRMLNRSLVRLALAWALCALPALAADDVYEEDVEFALEQLEEQCGHFFDAKDIDWNKVSKQFRKEVKKVRSDQDHLVLLVRLLARLKDGHAQVRPLEKGSEVAWPEEPERTGPGLFLCKIGKKIYVKNAWNDAADLGIQAGYEVLKIDGKAAAKWLEARVETLSDLRSFSTDHQAFFYACHWGLSEPIGTRLDIEFKDAKNKKRKRTITYRKASLIPWGPAFFPPDLDSTDDVNYGMLASGFGYVHVRRAPGDLPEQIDRALAAVAGAPGLILDFRGNSGGGFDHDAVLGRFVPKGHEMAFAKRIPSAGPKPYGGPVVVIVDATCRSAGETGSGMFKEDGRAYMIGESPTAGMSAQKTTIELPSGLFSLYVSVRSNKQRFNEGRGLEGIGAVPHELVTFDPEDLRAGEDTLIERAEELLRDFPQGEVPYDPKDFGQEG